MDQMGYSTPGDAILKTGLIRVLMKKEIQAKRGITQEKDQLEDTITLANVARRLRIKNFYGRAAGKKTCGGMAKIRSSRIHSKS